MPYTFIDIFIIFQSTQNVNINLSTVPFIEFKHKIVCVLHFSLMRQI